MKKKTILAENLKNLRKEHGLTQQKVADILKIKRSTYAYYEGGVTPNSDVLLKLSKLFSIPTHELLYGCDETEKKGVYTLNDTSSIFSTPDDNEPPISFSSLNTQEKFLIGYVRLLSQESKDKLLKDATELLEKAEEE